MSEDQVNRFISALQDQTIIADWHFYVLLVIVSIISALVGAFFKGYGIEKGKYSAINESLEIIKKQVSVTTQTAEDIKKEVDINLWREKDRETLKRLKLEEYLSFIFISKDSCHLEMENRLYNEKHDFDDQAYNKADLLQALYLPELIDEHNEYRKALVTFRQWLSANLTNLSERLAAGESAPRPTKELMSNYREIMENFNPSIIRIQEKAREVAIKINT